MRKLDGISRHSVSEKLTEGADVHLSFPSVDREWCSHWEYRYSGPPEIALS